MIYVAFITRIKLFFHALIYILYERKEMSRKKGEIKEKTVDKEVK